MILLRPSVFHAHYNSVYCLGPTGLGDQAVMGICPFLSLCIPCFLFKDPRLDDRCIRGTTALCDCRPLPQAVRVTAAHCHGDPAQMAEVDDIVVISHVEMGESDQGVRQKAIE